MGRNKELDWTSVHPNLLVTERVRTATQEAQTRDICERGATGETRRSQKPLQRYNVGSNPIAHSGAREQMTATPNVIRQAKSARQAGCVVSR